MQRTLNLSSGVTGKGVDMTTKIQTQALVDTRFFSIVGISVAGVLLLMAAGFAQASVVHDSAHDTRHAVAFPCH